MAGIRSNSLRRQNLLTLIECVLRNYLSLGINEY